jgi:hypothetical protein
MKELTIDKLNKKFNAMKNEANDWIDSWEDIARYERPSRGKFEGDIVNDGDEPDYQEILNNRVQLLVRTFASGMLSGMTNPSRKWFRLIVEDEELKDDHSIKVWLEQAEDLVAKIFSKSNVYGTLYSLYEEIGLFATGCAIINDDFETVIRMRNFTVGEYYLGNDYTGRVDSFAREFSMTVSQIVDEFGIDNVSLNTKAMYENKEFEKNVVIRHCIYPRKQFDDSKKDNLNMPFASYYWEKGSNEKKLLKESGYKIFPIIAPRWSTVTTSDIYGKDSAGWECLGDAKSLQVMEKDKLINQALIARPAMMLDSSIENWDMSPGGITIVDQLGGNKGIQPVEVVQADLAKIDASIKEVESRIADMWYANLFLMFSSSDDPRMTATEVIKRDSEKMLVLAPALERINNEAISPLIDITFDKILEGGMLGEVPEELQGKEIKIDYVSTIAQAQKMVGTAAIEQAAAFAGNLSAVFPEITDILNVGNTYRDYLNKLGISTKNINSKEVVAQIVEQRALAQQQQQQREQAQEMVQGAKVLSETEIRGNTALDALIGE